MPDNCSFICQLYIMRAAMHYQKRAPEVESSCCHEPPSVHQAQTREALIATGSAANAGSALPCESLSTAARKVCRITSRPDDDLTHLVCVLICLSHWLRSLYVVHISRRCCSPGHVQIQKQVRSYRVHSNFNRSCDMESAQTDAAFPNSLASWSSLTYFRIPHSAAAPGHLQLYILGEPSVETRVSFFTRPCPSSCAVALLQAIALSWLLLPRPPPLCPFSTA